MSKFIRVHQLNYGEVVINLDNVIRIEKTETTYRLYFNVTMVNEGVVFPYNIEVIDALEEYLPCLKAE